MKVSVLISADIAKDSKWSSLVPSTDGWTIIQDPIPSEIFKDGQHAAASRTVLLEEFVAMITKHEIFSIDDIGRNMAIRLSATKPGGVVHVYANPEFEADEMAKDGSPDQRYFGATWTHILKAIAAGAKPAEIPPQPLKSGGQEDAIHHAGRRSKTSR